MGADFQGILEMYKIKTHTQGVLGNLGLTETAVFAKICPDEPSFREFGKVDLLMDEGAGIVKRVEVAHLINAWDVSRARLEA